MRKTTESLRMDKKKSLLRCVFFNSLIDFNLHDYFYDSEDLQHIEIFCTFKMINTLKTLF